MNSILVMSKKLRTIANLIDELFIDRGKENSKTAAKITAGKKPFKYNGKHWTQTAKGKAHMRRIQKIRWQAKKAS